MGMHISISKVFIGLDWEALVRYVGLAKSPVHGAAAKNHMQRLEDTPEAGTASERAHTRYESEH